MRKRMCNLPMPSFARRHPNLARKGQRDFASGTRRYCLDPRAVSPLRCEGHWIVEGMDRREHPLLPGHILCKGLHCLLACWQSEYISSAFCEG
jgi:hypothetical protein